MKHQPSQKITSFVMCACLGIAILLALGTWQMQRLQWKQEVLNKIHIMQTQDYVALPTDHIKQAEWNYQRVFVTGRFVKGADYVLLPRIYQGSIGRHVLGVLQLKETPEKYIVVNRGFVPNNHDYTTPEQVVTVKGVLKQPDDQNMFTPDHSQKDKDIYWTDTDHIAKRQNISLITPMVLYEDGVTEDGKYPIPGQLRIEIPNNHLQYAIFWYTMALILAMIMGMFITRQKR